MADAIIIAILIICGLLALRACLRKKRGKGGSCCRGNCGCCGGCGQPDNDKDNPHS